MQMARDSRLVVIPGVSANGFVFRVVFDSEMGCVEKGRVREGLDVSTEHLWPGTSLQLGPALAVGAGYALPGPSLLGLCANTPCQSSAFDPGIFS
jgi:hypothetical protein